MSDTYEKNLGQKASLTKSDYIRIVGSDNASYKQSINNVMTTMGINPYNYANNSGSFLDWVKATFTDNGDYYVLVATNNYTDWCTNALGTCIVQKRNSDWYLIAMSNDTSIANNQSIYINKNNGGNWVGWTKLPTRAEIDAVSTKTAVTVTASTNVVIDANKSWKYGKTLFLNVKGHTTAALNNASMFVFAGATVSPNSFTFGIPIGDGAWSIGGITYGYINSNGVVGTISSGKYFHIAQTFLCE